MTIEIVGYLIIILNIIILPWSVWVTKNIFELKYRLELNDHRDKQVNDLLKKVNDALKVVADSIQNLELSLAENGIRVKKNN